jgi:hypothetical protein
MSVRLLASGLDLCSGVNDVVVKTVPCNVSFSGNVKCRVTKK